MNSTFYIVTPSYNCARYIDATILSVVTQAGDFTIHYHVQDGGSSDGTQEKLRGWEERLKAPSPWVFCNGLTFTWDSAPDKGMYDAVNQGFARQAAPPDGIMAWMNSDDEYMPHAFSTAAKAFKDIPDMEWFGGVTDVVCETGALKHFPEYRQPYPTELIRGHCCGGGHWRVLQQNGIFWKGTLWQKAGPLNAALRYAGDFEFWPRVAGHADFLHFPVVLGTFRSREGQLSRSGQYRAEMEQVCPAAAREAAVRAFWKKQKGAPLAPALCLDEQGNFSRCQRKTLPDPEPRDLWWKRLLRSVLPSKAIDIIKRIRQRVRIGRKGCCD